MSIGKQDGRVKQVVWIVESCERTPQKLFTLKAIFHKFGDATKLVKGYKYAKFNSRTNRAYDSDGSTIFRISARRVN
jgi:hypothetical protein